MEKELNEVILEEELGNETVKTKRDFSKVKVLGIAAMASVTALLFKFRKKINTKIEGRMVKSLTKKGYTILDPVNTSEISEKIEETLLENL